MKTTTNVKETLTELGAGIPDLLVSISGFYPGLDRKKAPGTPIRPSHGWRSRRGKTWRSSTIRRQTDFGNVSCSPGLLCIVHDLVQRQEA